jgi:hypothetical protein
MRETKKITTPSGKEVEIKTYLTARERNELRSLYLKNAQVDVSNGEQSVKGFTGAIVEEAEKKLIELMIVNYDGNAENISERLLDGTPEDYDFIVSELDKATKGGFQTAK